MNKKFNIDILLIVVSIIIASFLSFFINKICQSDDIAFHTLRLDGFMEAIKNFSIPYRLNSSANAGYTSADPIMYPHLLLVIPAFFYFIFHNYIIAWNLTFIFGNILQAIVMYYSCQSIFNKKEVSLIATIMMELSSARIGLIYNVAAFHEFYATMFIPLIASGYINIMRGEKRKWLELFIGLFFVLQIHIITFFYTSILLFIISLIYIKKIFSKKEIILTYIKTLVLVVITNLWFIVPFLDYFMSGKIVKPGASIKNDWGLSSIMSFADQLQVLWNRFKLMFVFTPITTTHRQLTYMSIFAIIFIIIVFVFRLLRKEDIGDNEKKDIAICKIFIIIFIYSIIVYLGFFTRVFFAYFIIFQKFFNMEQFEAREVFRTQPLFFIAFSYIYVKVVKRKIFRFAPIFIFGIIPIVMFYNYSLSQLISNINYKKFSNGDYMLVGTLTGNTSSRIINDYKCVFPSEIFDEIVNLSKQDFEIVKEKKGYLSYEIEYNVINQEKKPELVIPYFAYDGFVAENKKGKKVKIKKGENCLITLTPTSENDTFYIKYREKPIWLICDIISLLSLVLLLIYSIKIRLNSRK